MSRNKGTFNFSSNYEVLTKAPLDARTVVDTKSNLITPNMWQDADSNIWLYKGLVVSVVADPSIENNGLYFLLDDTTYTSYDSWLKIITDGSVDITGTSSATFQLNNDEQGIVLKDVSGNLEIVKFDNSTYANVTAGHININSLKIDTLNGVLYASDGSIFSLEGSYPLKAYDGILLGNGITTSFVVDHSLNTLRQNITIFDNTNEVIYPGLKRGLDSDTIIFNEPPETGVNYEIVILGF
jgi:hypothetical protein